MHDSDHLDLLQGAARRRQQAGSHPGWLGRCTAVSVLTCRRERRDGGSLLATWSASLAKDGKLNRRNLTLPSTLLPPFALPSEGRIDD